MKTRRLTLAVTIWTLCIPLGAQAVTCVDGVYRAGCVGPNGAVVTRKVPAPPPRAVVVTPAPVVVKPAPVVVTPAHGCRWVNGVRVCR